ncbi:MAG: hypothetical protein RMK19_05315 [Bacteroidia bacterium]|nr:hypothetical protein [Bacteroidia bacterium]MDW8015412.1 hypothetical protein [Bacteroidia bacterium]
MHTLRVVGGLIVLAFAQETSSPSDYENPSQKKARGGIQFYQEVAYNSLLGSPETLQSSVEGLGSIKINLSLLPRLRFGAFYFGAGGGIAIREVRFEEPLILFSTPEKRFNYFVDSMPENVRTKSKFQLGYLRIPIEIGILRRNFNFAVFAYGEALIWSKHKRKYREGNDLSRFIVYGNRNFQTEIVQYGIGGRIGYRGIGIFGAYNLSPLWRSEKGPKNVRALQAGIYIFQTLHTGSSSPTRKASLVLTQL